MALTTTSNKISYTSGASQTDFDYPFTIYASTDLEVYDNAVLQTSGYTVTNVGVDGGGKVVFAVGRVAGHTILIVRVEPANQLTVLPTSGPFPAKSVEKMSDKLTMLIQQLQETDKRALKLLVTSAFTDMVLRDPVAGQYLRWLDTATVDSAAIVPAGSLGLPVGFTDGGTGANYASAAALAKGLGLALWGGSAAGSLTLTVTAGIGQLPDPLTTNIFVCSSNLSGLTGSLPNPRVGTRILIYSLGSITLTHGVDFQLFGAANRVTGNGDVHEFTFVGATAWIETDRFIVPTGANALKFWRGDGSWQRAQIDPPLGAISGYVVSNNGGDPTNDVDVSVGEASSDDATASSREVIALTASITKQLDAAWVVGTNQGMRSGAALADGTWHVFAIKRTDTGVVDIFADTSLSPGLPADYTKKRYLHSLIRVGGAIKAFVMDGDGKVCDVLWSTSVLDIDVANPGTSAVTRTLNTVPNGIKVDAHINVLQAEVTTNYSSYVSSLDQSDEAPSTTVAPLATIKSTSTGTSINMRVRTNTAKQIRTRQTSSGAGDLYKIATLGYTYKR